MAAPPTHSGMLPGMTMSTGSKRLPPSSRLMRNTTWSCIGSAAPMLVAVIAVPRLIQGLGADRFGILTLAWMAIGYLSFLDLGLGRAITRLIADRLALRRHQELPGIFWDAHLLLAGVALAGGAMAWVLSGVLLNHALKIPAALHDETRNCFHLIAVTIPVVVLANGLRGFLEAHQRFRAVNVIRVLVGIAGFLGPLCMLHWSPRVDITVAMLSAVRIITLVAFFVCCLLACPEVWTRRCFGVTPLAPLLRFGGWIAFDNVLGPLMISVDRFLIASLLSVGMATYYVTPQEMMTKLLIIPMGLQQAIFPAFAGLSREAAAVLYRKSADTLLLLMLPLALLVRMFSREVLTLWLGAPFASRSFMVLQWLAVGVLINSLAHLPSSMIQAIGHPEVNAKIHLLELPLYLVVAWWMISQHGIVGAAIAWVGRVTVDAICFFAVGYRVLPCSPFTWRNVGAAVTIMTLGCMVTHSTQHASLKVLFALVASAVTVGLSAQLLASPAPIPQEMPT
jgi:O-antigen/teichoic acid export membrane protein